MALEHPELAAMRLHTARTKRDRRSFLRPARVAYANLLLTLSLSACEGVRAGVPMYIVDHDGVGRGVAGGMAFVDEHWQATVGIGSVGDDGSSSSSDAESNPSGGGSDIRFVLAIGPLIGDHRSSWFSLGPIGFIDPETGRADWGGFLSLFIYLDKPGGRARPGSADR